MGHRQDQRTAYQPPQQQAQQPYQPPYMAHQFVAPAPYPYAGGASPDPRAVGPQWAQPAAAPPARDRGFPAPAPRPAQARSAPRAEREAPAKPGFIRRAFSFLFTLLSVVVLIAGGAFVVIAILNNQGLLNVNEDDLPVVLPEQPIAIPSITPLNAKPDKTAEAAWSSGACGDFSKERDLPAYQAGRNSGSAQALRGRTAALAIKLNSPSLVFTKALDLNVDRAALMTQRFYLTNAQKRSLNDLKFDVIPWPLKTAYTLPGLNLDANQRLPTQTMDLIRDSSRLAIETALGAPLDKVTAQLRKSGYDNVAYFIFIPVKTTARSFAVPSYRSAPTSYPEASFLFVPQNDFGHFAVTMAHEGLHLFGADDLYRIKNVDKADEDDVMGEYCTGFLKARVGDATAFAIGWLPNPPARKYTFDVK